MLERRTCVHGNAFDVRPTFNLSTMTISALRVARRFLAVSILFLLFAGAVRLIRLYRSVKANKRYWRQRASAPVQNGDFIYLALGDSVANGIGATCPEKGYVGLIAQKIHDQTGRFVHVINLSVTGATASDVIHQQLPLLDELHPDLVTLDIGANDINQRIPAVIFMKNFRTILDALPAEKAIVADLPTFQRGPERSTLIRINTQMHEELATRRIKLAPIFDVTSETIHDWRTYGADFFHPSNKGHRNWCRAFETQLNAIISEGGKEVQPLTP